MIFGAFVAITQALSTRDYYPSFLELFIIIAITHAIGSWRVRRGWAQQTTWKTFLKWVGFAAVLFVVLPLIGIFFVSGD
jgi:hypothetical protein